MKKLITILIILLSGQTVHAKTTYIPTYRSILQIVNSLNDTISQMNNLGMLEMMGRNGMYKVTIAHEDVTKEKVKAIKRAKAAAGWMTFAAIMSGVSAGLSRNYVSFYINMENTKNSAILSDILDIKSKGEQTLSIEVWVDNLSDHELMVADMERGSVWFILPHNTLQLTLSNPGIEQLRISDVNHHNVEYVTALAGSSVKKYEITWEDEECWIVPESETTFLEFERNVQYECINKETYETRMMTKKEMKDYVKLRKTLIDMMK